MRGKDLGKFRKNLGMTQEKLAQALGVSRSLLARWESEDRALSRRTELAAKQVADTLFWENAPEEYRLLIEELKSLLQRRAITGVQVVDLYNAAGGHVHTCIGSAAPGELGACGLRYWCFCQYEQQDGRCPECERRYVETAEEEAIEAA